MIEAAITGPARPLRAVAVILVGWTAIRLWAWLPIASPHGEPAHAAPSASAPEEPEAAHWSTLPEPRNPVSSVRRADVPPAPMRDTPSPEAHPRRFHHADAVAMTAATVAPAPQGVVAPPRPDAPLGEGMSAAVDRHQASLLSGSAWALFRGDGGQSLADGGALGGAQAGMRVFARVHGALSATVRLSTPLNGPGGREAAIGIALRHGAAGVIVERRIALSGDGRNGTAVIAYAGVYDRPVAAGIKLDGYVQAGMVRQSGTARFADGAATLTRHVTGNRDHGVELAMGGGAWAGAQPGVARLDIGRTVSVRGRLGNLGWRINGEWRQRVAGNAAPGSGPTISAGIDF